MTLIILLKSIPLSKIKPMEIEIPDSADVLNKLFSGKMYDRNMTIVVIHILGLQER